MATKFEQFSVSVVVPVHNGEAFLREAIQSIQRQDWGAAEIVVVDDGSTDRTAARSLLVSVTRSGMCNSRTWERQRRATEESKWRQAA